MKKWTILKFIFIFLISSCTQFSEIEKDAGEDPSTVEVGEVQGSHDQGNISNNKQKETFSAHVIKANRNKKISLFLGKLEDRMFYAIGIIKWLENNGYKIIKIQTTSSEEEQLFSEIKNNRKTSYVEWKLYQCCKENFPFEDAESYKEILKKMETKVIIPSYPQDQKGCDDFSTDNNEDHVLCVLLGSENKIQITQTEIGMKKVEVFISPIDYQSKLSLVDYIDQGQNMAKAIKK
jgi:hypothetical protein